MPTIVSHAAVPLALGLGLGDPTVPRRLLLLGIGASMLPDADVLTFHLGATYADVWSHRGFSHSIGFAVALGLVVAIALRRSVPPLASFLFIGASTLSHGLLDMLTNGGHGVALLWPFSAERFFFEWRPIQVAPLALSRFPARAERIIGTELLWIWLPATVVAWAIAKTCRAKGADR